MRVEKICPDVDLWGIVKGHGRNAKAFTGSGWTSNFIFKAIGWKEKADALTTMRELSARMKQSEPEGSASEAES